MARPKPRPLTADTPVVIISSSRSTTSCWVAEVQTLTRPCAPIRTVSACLSPGCSLSSASVLTRGPTRGGRGLSRTIASTGISDSASSTPPPRKTRRRPRNSAASPPTTGPIALPSATADVTTPSAQPTRERGVSAATSAVAAATVPLVAPCSRRSTTSSAGFCAK